MPPIWDSHAGGHARPWGERHDRGGQEPADVGMTPSQRFLLDMNGFLHLRGVLEGDELAAAQAAAERYNSAPPDELPEPFRAMRQRQDAETYARTPNLASHLQWAIGLDKSLEQIVFHPKLWPIILELTNGKPQLRSGHMICEDHRPGGHGEKPVHLHSAKEDWGEEGSRFASKNGRIFCENFVIFPYLSDVHEGDGGVLVLPGSHKSEFVRPPELYGLFGEGARIRDRYGLADRDLWSEDAESYDGKFEGERWRDAFRMSDGPETLDAFLDPMAEDLGMRNICPNAGDVLIIPEAMTHGVLPWMPKDRTRTALILRMHTQHSSGGPIGLPDDIAARLSPETRELVAPGSYTQTKRIATQAVVRLGDAGGAEAPVGKPGSIGLGAGAGVASKL